MNSQGYKWRQVIDAFIPEERHIEKRLEFCKRHRNNDWSRIIFLDESIFRLHTCSSYAGFANVFWNFFFPTVSLNLLR